MSLTKNKGHGSYPQADRLMGAGWRYCARRGTSPSLPVAARRMTLARLGGMTTGIPKRTKKMTVLVLRGHAHGCERGEPQGTKQAGACSASISDSPKES